MPVAAVPCNPFTLDQFIEIWCRGALDDVYTFVWSTTATADRSWVDWDVVASCGEKLWLAWVELSQKRPLTKLEANYILVLSKRLLAMPKKAWRSLGGRGISACIDWSAQQLVRSDNGTEREGT